MKPDVEQTCLVCRESVECGLGADIMGCSHRHSYHQDCFLSYLALSERPSTTCELCLTPLPFIKPEYRTHASEPVETRSYDPRYHGATYHDWRYDDFPDMAPANRPLDVILMVIVCFFVVGAAFFFLGASPYRSATYTFDVVGLCDQSSWGRLRQEEGRDVLRCFGSALPFPRNRTLAVKIHEDQPSRL